VYQSNSNLSQRKTFDYTWDLRGFRLKNISGDLAIQIFYASTIKKIIKYVVD